MNLQEIIEHLINGEIKISEITTYSLLPGIYAIFFIGDQFPLENLEIPKNRIIYIGKTESSQQSRDANTHFKSGKTGSSTIRKSIGALLSQSEEIIPVIRSKTDIVKERRSHYKFDDASEEKVTKWMMSNLAVSFYEYPKSKEEINNLETELISVLKPVLNIDSKNTENSHKETIKDLRKRLGIIAHSNFIQENKNLGKKKENVILASPKRIVSNSVSTGKYVGIWTAYLEDIKKAINSDILWNTIQLDKELFKQAGNRGNYTFNIKYINGKVSNNISGSAVARDLDKVIKDSKIPLQNRTIKMTKEFKLIIQ